MKTRHKCPQCGHPHHPPDPVEECMCGHLRILHDDDGGKRRRAPCTFWIDIDTNPTQCPCESFHT